MTDKLNGVLCYLDLFLQNKCRHPRVCRVYRMHLWLHECTYKFMSSLGSPSDHFVRQLFTQVSCRIFIFTVQQVMLQVYIYLCRCRFFRVFSSHRISSSFFPLSFRAQRIRELQGGLIFFLLISQLSFLLPNCDLLYPVVHFPIAKRDLFYFYFSLTPSVYFSPYLSLRLDR